jgi:hypothetical protein
VWLATDYKADGTRAAGTQGITEDPGLAGDFVGDVVVAGNLFKHGGGFLIDHPLDPANRFLAHSFVESPEMANLYDGTIILDAAGQATVRLPEWFEALNENFRYQLTAIGRPAPGLHVAHEIADRHFVIAGGDPGLKVSWQVTGIRKDRWARANPIVIERDKREHERGYYLSPSLYDEPAKRRISRIRHPAKTLSE